MRICARHGCIAPLFVFAMRISLGRADEILNLSKQLCPSSWVSWYRVKSAVRSQPSSWRAMNFTRRKYYIYPNFAQYNGTSCQSLHTTHARWHWPTNELKLYPKTKIIDSFIVKVSCPNRYSLWKFKFCSLKKVCRFSWTPLTKKWMSWSRSCNNTPRLADNLLASQPVWGEEQLHHMIAYQHP